jgi:hypothetical protein
LKKLALLGGLVIIALLTRGHAADHLDSDSLATNPLGDINDVYAWMNEDATKVNLAMTVSPADQGTLSFGPSVLYVFHVTSKSGLGVAQPGGKETRIICQFDSATKGSCWVSDDLGLTKDFVTGDPSNTAGITSSSGKVRFFAGQRSDPFFFNLQGFRNAVKQIKTAKAGITFDGAGCPMVCPSGDTTCAGTATALRGILSSPAAVGEAPCPNAQVDCFANLNVLAIVLQVDKTLFNDGSNIALGVWGSTHIPGISMAPKGRP